MTPAHTERAGACAQPPCLNFPAASVAGLFCCFPVWALARSRTRRTTSTPVMMPGCEKHDLPQKGLASPFRAPRSTYSERSNPCPSP